MFQTFEKAGKIEPCQYPGCDKLGVWYHQRTQYVKEESNWTCLCPKHAEENDEYWDDMWADYYSGCL